MQSGSVEAFREIGTIFAASESDLDETALPWITIDQLAGSDRDSC